MFYTSFYNGLNKKFAHRNIFYARVTCKVYNFLEAAPTLTSLFFGGTDHQPFYEYEEHS